jgi:hypothetical protein
MKTLSRHRAVLKGDQDVHMTELIKKYIPRMLNEILEFGYSVVALVQIHLSWSIFTRLSNRQRRCQQAMI